MKTMTAKQAAEAAKGLTFEKVWAAMMKSERELKEYRKESDRRMEESFKRMEKTVADLSKNLGGISDSLGDLTESMFRNELWKKFSDIGIPVTGQCSNKEFRDHNKRVLTEVDVFMENGDCVIAVEIKTKLKIKDVNEHLKRIEIVRRDLDGRGDKRKIFGAVACGSVTPKVMEHAQEKGLYVVVQNGESVSIADAPQGFKVREW